MSERMRVRIAFNSGHVEEMTFDEFNIVRSNVTEKFSGVTWKQSGGGAMLQYINCDEIASIVALPDRSQNEPPPPPRDRPDRM